MELLQDTQRLVLAIFKLYRRLEVGAANLCVRVLAAIFSTVKHPAFGV